MCGMTDPILRLDPRRPLLWRDPTTLQLGADPVLAVLDDIDDAQLRLVETLVVGATRERLLLLAAHLGVRDDRVDALLDLLGAALEAGASPAPVAEPLAVVGRGPGAARVAAVLTEAGHPVTALAPGAPLARTARWGAAVLVSTNVADPHEHPRWLRRDLPHLPIVFGEVAVTVGPLVLPGTSPCLTCVERHRARHDPARSALAAQLWGRGAAAETAGTALEAAVTARGMLRSREAGTSIRIDTASGARAAVRWSVADDCRCVDLSPPAEPAARRGTGSGRVPAASAPGARPTTARGRAEHG